MWGGRPRLRWTTWSSSANPAENHDRRGRRPQARGPAPLYAGFMVIDPISRVSLVTQLICRL